MLKVICNCSATLEFIGAEYSSKCNPVLASYNPISAPFRAKNLPPVYPDIDPDALYVSRIVTVGSRQICYNLHADLCNQNLHLLGGRNHTVITCFQYRAISRVHRAKVKFKRFDRECISRILVNSCNWQNQIGYNPLKFHRYITKISGQSCYLIGFPEYSFNNFICSV